MEEDGQGVGVWRNEVDVVGRGRMGAKRGRECVGGSSAGGWGGVISSVPIDLNCNSPVLTFRCLPYIQKSSCATHLSSWSLDSQADIRACI